MHDVPSLKRYVCCGATHSRSLVERHQSDAADVGTTNIALSLWWLCGESVPARLTWLPPVRFPGQGADAAREPAVELRAEGGARHGAAPAPLPGRLSGRLRGQSDSGRRRAALVRPSADRRTRPLRCPLLNCILHPWQFSSVRNVTQMWAVDRRPAGGGADSAPCLTHRPVAVARRAKWHSKGIKEYFMMKF